MNEGPSNKFREELNKREVSDADMLERDQRVTWKEMKHLAAMKEYDRLHLLETIEIDRSHLQGAIDKLKAFGNEIFRLPDCEAREAILANNKQTVEQLEKRIDQLEELIEQYAPTRAQQVILSILEEKFGQQSTTIVEPPSLEEAKGDEPSELKDE